MGGDKVIAISSRCFGDHERLSGQNRRDFNVLFLWPCNGQEFRSNTTIVDPRNPGRFVINKSAAFIIGGGAVKANARTRLRSQRSNQIPLGEPLLQHA